MRRPEASLEGVAVLVSQCSVAGRCMSGVARAVWWPGADVVAKSRGAGAIRSAAASEKKKRVYSKN